MNYSVIKKLIYVSSMSLVPQMILAHSNIHTSKNIEIRKLQERIAILEHKQKETLKNTPIDPVLALPQENFRPKYNTAPVYNQDLAMLKMRKSYDRQIKKRKIHALPYPHIELGGSVIGVASLHKSPQIAPLYGSYQNDLSMSGANFDVNTEILDMLLANIRISYDPGLPERVNSDTITTRINNSNIFLNTAFLTFGDLKQSPFYFSIGQMFLPFGEYSSSTLTAPLPGRLGRMKQRPILLGVEPNTLPGFNASVFMFKGDAYTGINSGLIRNGGGNVSYTLSHSLFNLTTAGSYIANIADSGGMQNTGPSTIVTDAGEQIDNQFLDDEDDENDPFPDPATFRGFGIKGGELLAHKVPAYDARARLKLNGLPFSFFGEYLTAGRAFAPQNVSFNTNDFEGDQPLIGATPSAWNVEGIWSFSIANHQSSITLGYGHSSQALTFNLPQSTEGITFRTKFKKVISCALGFQYDTAYPAGTYATGQLLEARSNKFTGTTSKTVSAQVSASF